MPSIDDISWAGNSRAMYDKIVSTAPVFMQGKVRSKFLEWTEKKNLSAITEALLEAHITETIPFAFRGMVLAQLASLKSVPTEDTVSTSDVTTNKGANTSPFGTFGMSLPSLPAELVRFPAEGTLFLHGLFWQPSKRIQTAVVYVPGFGSGFVGPNDVTSFATSIMEAGYPVLAMNMRGVSPTGMVYTRFEDCLEDIDGALGFLRSRGYTKFVLVGDSLGGCRVAYYLANRKTVEVPAVVIMGGILSPYQEAMLRWNDAERAEYETFLDHAKALVAAGKGSEVVTYAWGSGRPLSLSADTLVNTFSAEGNTDILKNIKAITTPVLVLHGSQDSVSLPENGRQIYEALTEAKSREMIMVEADHFFIGEEDARAYGEPLGKWLAETLH